MLVATRRMPDGTAGNESKTMIRRFLIVCSIGYLAGAIGSVASASAESATGIFSCRVRAPESSSYPVGDRHLDCQQSPPLVADAKSDDGEDEEFSRRDQLTETPVAQRYAAADVSRRAALLDAATQHRVANTLNALQVRLQI